MARNYCPYCMNPVVPGQSCSKCGHDPAAYRSEPHHFPAGKLLAGRYLVGRSLGEGGFGITYLGWDVKLDRRVAIKEYFPRTLVRREASTNLNVTCYAGSGSYFEKGRDQFLQEARTLAKLGDVPEIVIVWDFFEENNSAYIVMEFLEGTTLKDIMAERGRIPAWELFDLMGPVLRGMDSMHKDGLIHRDISPDNLMRLEKKGTVSMKLMDFGCAREIGAGHTMTIMLKPGFAPPEQYTGHEQGPWTDVYAICATMYYCLTGKIPPDAMRRLGGEEVIPPSRLGVEISRQQEKALMKGLERTVAKRWKSIAALYDALYLGAPVLEEPDVPPVVMAEPIGTTMPAPAVAEIGATMPAPAVAAAVGATMPAPEVMEVGATMPAPVAAEVGATVPASNTMLDAQALLRTGKLSADLFPEENPAPGLLATDKLPPELNSTGLLTVEEDAPAIAEKDTEEAPVLGVTMPAPVIAAEVGATMPAPEVGVTMPAPEPAMEVGATVPAPVAAEVGATMPAPAVAAAAVGVTMPAPTVAEVVGATEPAPVAANETEHLSRYATAAAVADEEEKVEYIGGAPVPPPAAPAKKNNTPIIAAACAALLLIGGLVFWFAHPHSYKDWVVTKEPTCTAEGLREQKCFCGKGISETIAPLGHKETADAAVAATCTETGLTAGSHCDRCGQVLVAQKTLDSLGHTIEYLEAVEPTCTEEGLSEAIGCSVCGYTEKERETIPALGHTPMVLAGRAASCSQEGLTDGSICAICGDILTPQNSLGTLPHTEVEDPAVTATCTQDGLSAGSHCSVCGTVIVPQVVNSYAAGHSFVSNVCSYCGVQKWQVSAAIVPDHYEGSYLVVYVSCSLYGAEPGSSTLVKYSATCPNGSVQSGTLSCTASGQSDTLSFTFSDWKGRSLSIVFYDAAGNIIGGASYGF